MSHSLQFPLTFIIKSIQEIGTSTYSLYTAINATEKNDETIATNLKSMSKILKLQLELISSNKTFDAFVYSSIVNLNLLTPIGSTVSFE